jgi:predicted TPR repeat methyltransferase
MRRTMASETLWSFHTRECLPGTTRDFFAGPLSRLIKSEDYVVAFGEVDGLEALTREEILGASDLLASLVPGQF